MKISLQTIGTLLQTLDIEGLINVGAPQDEYELEAQLLFSALSHLSQEEFIEKNIFMIVSEIWAKNFNLNDTDLKLRHSAITTLAKELAKHT